MTAGSLDSSAVASAERRLLAGAVLLAFAAYVVLGWSVTPELSTQSLLYGAALLLLFWFSFKLPIFPLGGVGTPAHLVLPALTAGLGGAAWYARMARSSTLDVLTADYVRTARAKGLTDRRVLLRHVLPNALNPIVTMAGMDIPWFVGGVVLVEQVFAWPGIGRMAVEAIIQVDIPLIMGTVIFTAVLVVISSILIDLVQGIIDPRIRRATGHAS